MILLSTVLLAHCLLLLGSWHLDEYGRNYSEDIGCDRSLLPSLYDLDRNTANQLLCQLKHILPLQADCAIHLLYCLEGKYFLTTKLQSNKALVKVLPNLCLFTLAEAWINSFIRIIDHGFLRTTFIWKLLAEKAFPFQRKNSILCNLKSSRNVPFSPEKDINLPRMWS